MLAHQEAISAWQGCEDGEVTVELFNMIGLAFLPSLAELERNGLLKEDSDMKDLAIFIADFLDVAEGWEPYGIEQDGWRKNAIAYVKKYGIDMTIAFSLKSKWAKRQEDGDPDKLPSADKNENDPWEWKTKFAEYERKHTRSSGPPSGRKRKANKPHIGVTHWDITKWTRADRARAAYDGKDLIPTEMVKAMKEGAQIALAPA